MKVVVFGAGDRGKNYCVNSKEDILAFADNNPYKWGEEYIGHTVIRPDDIPQYEYDRIVITVYYKDNKGGYIVNEILEQLRMIGVPQNKIFLYSLETLQEVNYLGIDFLRSFYDIYSETNYLKFFEEMYPKSIAISHRDYLMERCGNKELLIYGTGIDAIRLTKYLSIIGIHVRYYIDDERAGSTLNDKKIVSSIDIVYEETDKIFIIIVNEKECYGISRKKFIDIGLLEDIDFTYHTEVPVMNTAHHFDVTLSFSRKREEIEGFELFGDINNPNAIKIVALGGSTTESSLYFVKGWVQFLADFLQQNNIPAIVYGGGVCAYNSTQELLKFIRDVIPLKPDIVLSYSGYNDLQMHPGPNQIERYKRPFITQFQMQFVNQIIEKLSKIQYSVSDDGVNWDIGLKGTVFYGLKNDKTVSEFWIDNMRMMHVISTEFGIPFIPFFQPFRINGYYESTDTQNIILNRRDPSSMGTPNADFVNIFLADFQRMKEEIKNYDFIIDLSDIFMEHKNIYFDSCHVYERGNQIIAENIYNTLAPHLRRLS